MSGVEIPSSRKDSFLSCEFFHTTDLIGLAVKNVSGTECQTVNSDELPICDLRDEGKMERRTDRNLEISTFNSL